MPSQSAYQPGLHLSRGDVALDNPTEPAMIRVILRCSKTDQLGKVVEVFAGKTGCDICPVSAVAACIWVTRGNQQGPFFKSKDGRPLTKSKFTHAVRDVLQKSGLPYQSFAGHSFIVLGLGRRQQPQKLELRTQSSACWEGGTAQLSLSTFKHQGNNYLRFKKDWRHNRIHGILLLLRLHFGVHNTSSLMRKGCR